MRRKILVIDIGGSNVKLMISRSGKRKFKSGPHLTPREMVAQIEPLVSDWKFDAISIGFPSPVRDVEHALVQLKKALIADYVVLGGGNAKKFDELPRGIERGQNRNAFFGGTRLWQIDLHTQRPKWQIL